MDKEGIACIFGVDILLIFSLYRIVQYYVTKEESGTLASNKFDRNKVSTPLPSKVVNIDTKVFCFISHGAFSYKQNSVVTPS